MGALGLTISKGKGMFFRKTAVLLTCGLLVLLGGCANNTPRIAHTASGNPEVFIPKTTVEEVRSALIDRTMAAGFSLDSDSGSRLVVSKQMDGMRESLMRVAIGNSSSTPVRSETAFAIVSVNDGVKVYASNSAWTQMPFGKINRVPLNSNEDFNITQSSLLRLKASLGKIDSKNE